MLSKGLDPLASNSNDSLARSAVLLWFTWKVDFARSWCSSPMKTLRGKQYSFKELNELTRLNNLLDRLASNIHDSLTRATVLLPFTCKGDLEQRWCSWPLKTLRGRQHSFQQLTQFKVLNKVHVPVASNTSDSLPRASVLLHSLQKATFPQGFCSSGMQRLRDRPYSFKQLSHFTMLKKVLDSLAFNMNGSLTGETVLLPFTWKRLCCPEVKVFIPSKPEGQAVFPLKVNSILTGIQHASPSSFQQSWFY
jgi:hypothetical protein